MNWDQIEAIRRYAENATPEERRELAAALLEIDDGGKRVGYTPLSPGTVWLSRAASVPALAANAYLLSGVAVHPLRIIVAHALPLLLVWYPNQFSSAVGHLTLSSYIDRPSSPRIVLGLSWVWLCWPLLMFLARLVRTFST